jgi:CheY-like chemotaxis protein
LLYLCSPIITMTDHKLQVCVIDDDFIYQFAAKKTIEATGLAEEILSFSNGKEAINYLEEKIAASTEVPDVIFLDINMPVMDGWEFLEAYNPMQKSLKKKIIIYIVSSSNSDYDVAYSKKFNCVSDYIIKPVHKEKFEQLLTLHLS